MKSRLVTRQFGELEFDDTIVYHFPNGLFGFEEYHDFIIIDTKETEPIRWLLSVNDPNIGFAILEGSLIAPRLYSEVSSEEISVVVFVVVVLRRDPDPVTANLKAPIVINTIDKTGKQIVLNSDEYSTEHKII